MGKNAIRGSGVDSKYPQHGNPQKARYRHVPQLLETGSASLKVELLNTCWKNPS